MLPSLESTSENSFGNSCGDSMVSRAPASDTSHSVQLRTGEPSKTSWSAWLGDAVAIKDSTRAVFRRQSGSNLMLVGQQDESAVAMFTSAVLSLTQSQPDLEPMPLVFAQALEGTADEVVNVLPEIAPVQLTLQRDLPSLLGAWSDELDKRNHSTVGSA